MIVSIHQPQYIPWLPYFHKVSESDVFILLDSVEFQKNGLQNRNRIKTAGGISWLTVPVRQRLGQKILDVEINNNDNWQKKHAATIVQNYRKSPFFMIYSQEIKEVYDREWHLLVDLNIYILKWMLRNMGITANILRSSNMHSHGKGTELILNLCLEVGATKYLSGIGGKKYINDEDFFEAGVEVVYVSPVLPTAYPQQHSKVGFISDLSAIDILLNCGASWRNYLNYNVEQSEAPIKEGLLFQ